MIEDDGSPEIDGWITHNGGKCPIPWAKKNEAQVRLRGGQIVDIGDVVRWRHAVSECECHPGDIIAYRLTNGWIPAVDAISPIAGAHGELEIKRQDGSVINNIGNWCIGEGISTCVVAVRRIKHPKPTTATDKEDAILYEALKHSVKIIGKQQENPYKLTPEERKEFETMTQPTLRIPVNEMKIMRNAIDGWGALLGKKEGPVVSVSREVFAALAGC